jgi:peptide/nickel transport system substrate-binding protein
MKFFIFITLFFNFLYSSTLYLSISSNPSRLNPILATDSASSEISGFIFNGLVKYDKNLTNIVGDLAKNYYFKDKKTLIFNLRKNIFWHDGVEFSADDVVFTYKTIISKNIISPYSSDFRFVKSVKALDKYSIEVKYTKVYFKALEIWMMGILPKHILENEQNIMNSSFNTNPIGTGPYKLEKLDFSKNIILKANSNYFETKPQIDTISFSIISDSSTRFLMLKSI